MEKILDAIVNRVSRRSFARRPVEREKIEALIEAFRWGPSSFNRQPWCLLFAESPAAVAAWVAALNDGNRAWAPAAPVKVVVLGNPEEQPDAHGQHRWLLDCGLAMQTMLVQGSAMGLNTRCMVGWDEDRVKQGFAVPEPWRVACLIAIGYPGRTEDLAPEVREKEKRPRSRKAAGEIAFRDAFGQARA